MSSSSQQQDFGSVTEHNRYMLKKSATMQKKSSNTMLSSLLTSSDVRQKASEYNSLVSSSQSLVISKKPAAESSSILIQDNEEKMEKKPLPGKVIQRNLKNSSHYRRFHSNQRASNQSFLLDQSTTTKQPTHILHQTSIFNYKPPSQQAQQQQNYITESPSNSYSKNNTSQSSNSSSTQHQQQSQFQSYSLSEKSRSSLNEFLRSGCREKGVDIEAVKSAVRESCNALDKLESDCRILQKENSKLNKMLEILQVSHRLKETFFQQMTEQNISIKAELDDLKLQKTQLQQMEVIKNMKRQSIQFPTTQTRQKSPLQTKTEIQAETAAGHHKMNLHVNTLSQKSIMWNQMKQILENKNILSGNPSATLLEPLSSSLNKSNNHIHTPTHVQYSGQSSPLTSGQSQSLLPNQNSKLIRLLKNNRAPVAYNKADPNEKKNLRPLFIQNSTDNAFYASALDLTVGNDDVTEFFLESKYMKFVKGHFSDEANLQKFIFNLEGETFKFFFESVNQLVTYLTSAMRLVLKTKQVVKCIFSLQKKMNISETFDSLTYHCSNILNCDKSSLYLLDDKSHLFWTKGSRNNEIIKVSLDEAGFCSHVAKTKEVINVLDAHLDDRFDKSMDEKNNYKTKSVLCVPIFDSTSHNQRIIGILQAVNKNDQTFFTKDDEGILKIIALLSENILKNSVFNDERAEFYNSLRFLYSYSIDAIHATSPKQLIEISYLFLQSSLNISSARILLYDSVAKTFYTYLQGKKVIFENSQGVIGKVFKSRQIKVSQNISEDVDFNKMIDIDTQLPVVTLPIFKSSSFYAQFNKPSPVAIEDFVQNDKSHNACIGVLQILNSRGITSLLIQSDKNSAVLLTNYETLQRFNIILAAAFSRLLQQEQENQEQ